MMTVKQKNPRFVAVEILNRVEAEGAFAENLIDYHISSSTFPHHSDKNLLTRIVYGVLQKQGNLDWIISNLYHGNFITMELGVKNILRCAIYQMEFMERVPSFAVCNDAVIIAKEIASPASGLVNAICRNYLRKRDSLEYPPVDEDFFLWAQATLSHSQWLIEEFVALYGKEETIKLCQANNEIPPVFLRVNGLLCSREELMKKLADEGVICQATETSVDGLKIVSAQTVLRDTKSFREGLFILQDEASQLISSLVAPNNGEDIIDICAGSGVKTTHLSAKMNNSGNIVAMDISENKLWQLSALCKKMGVKNVKTICADAKLLSGHELKGKFDKALLDAPCSGVGTLRRNPEIKWRLQKKHLDEFAKTQGELIMQAGEFLKRGGTLFYVTCSLFSQENEQIVGSFLEENRDFKLVTLNRGNMNNEFIENGFFKSLPHRTQTDGFFCACLRKN